MLELLIAFGILSLVLVAVTSFYVQAVAVTAKRDQVSERLRRFHLGLDKIEQTVREGRVVELSPYRLTLLHLSDLSEQDGFPLYSLSPLQFVSKEDGLYQLFDGQEQRILPFQPGERLIFQWRPENPGGNPKIRQTLLSIELYYSGAEDSRSDLLFRRTMILEQYDGPYDSQNG